MGTLRRTCAKVCEPSELRFEVLRGVGQGIAALDGVHVMQGEGEVFGVLVSGFVYICTYICIGLPVAPL